jgi:hypothetical protein
MDKEYKCEAVSTTVPLETIASELEKKLNSFHEQGYYIHAVDRVESKGFIITGRKQDVAEEQPVKSSFGLGAPRVIQTSLAALLSTLAGSESIPGVSEVPPRVRAALSMHGASIQENGADTDEALRACIREVYGAAVGIELGEDRKATLHAMEVHAECCTHKGEEGCGMMRDLRRVSAQMEVLIKDKLQ